MDSFASAADEAAATTKRLEKRSILAAYLRGLSDEELPVASVFLTGSPFPLRSERTVQVGGALLSAAALEAAGAAEAQFEAAYLRHGDSGEAVAELLSARPPPPASPRLLEARALFDNLSASLRTAERGALLAGVLKACRPAAAKYLVKIATSSMRIGVQESLVEDALAAAFERPPEAVRWANMLLGDIGRTAVLAREDRLGEARLALFRPLKFMLATAIDDAEDALGSGDEWLVEDKYDGIRAQVHSDGSDVRVYTRTLDEVTGQFPEVVGAFEGSPWLVADGEIIAQAGRDQLGFGKLSKRLGRKEPDERILREVPVAFVAFDLLAHEEEALLGEPLSTRRARLEEALPGHPLVSPSELTGAADAETIRDTFEAALGRDNEGLMLKRPDSPYQPGKRGKAWLKLKRPLATLDVAIVAAEYGHGKRAGLLSDYTFAVRAGDRLAPVGKAYSGVTDREIALLTDHFKQSAVKDFGRGVVVPPTVVIEVAFNGIQRSDRHQSGFALRFPRIKRLRLDKSVAEIDTIERVEELWSKQNLAT